VADAWLPSAGRLQTKHDGGSPNGGVPRVVWHTSENDPYTISALSVAQRLEQQRTSAHLVWNPHTGEIVQMLPATRAALMFPGGVGREGRRCLQIVVVGFARRPFTSGPLNGLDQIMGWLDLWKVPRHWPAGAPLRSPESYHSPRERRSWARGGHFGASQVPHTNGPTPGGIDVWKITGPEPPRRRTAHEEAPPVVDPDELLARRLTPEPVTREPAPSPASIRS
jgi:hypothetical protein